MAEQSLATKYRPKTFDDLTEQDCIKQVLTNQVETNSFLHAYLFTGPAGTGKTTSARIFARMINKGDGGVIEIDAASNSGVDNIRNVIEDSKRKPLDCDYKIFIIDECHSLSNGAWQALLKLLEEPPAFSVFLLCTTDAQKIPDTIMSRVQTFKFNKLSDGAIYNRLKWILEKENCNTEDDEVLTYITRLSNGGMRTAISYLDKCLAFGELSLQSAIKVLGTVDYETFFDLLTALREADMARCCDIVEKQYSDGIDIKQFLAEFQKFIYEVCKYKLSCKTLSIPLTDEMIAKLNQAGDEVFGISEILVDLTNRLKWEKDVKTLTSLCFIIYCQKVV